MGQPNPDKGSILAINTTDPTPVKIGGKVVSGDISVVNPTANVVVSGGSVGGSTDPNVIQTSHVHKGVDNPDFPTLDTSMFIPYATNKYVPGKGTYSNIIIPPNTNPSFSAGTVLKGVIYVKTPNRVSFSGNTSIQGVLVTDTEGQVGNLNTNTVTFQGGFDSKGVETLDASYGDLRNLSGLDTPGALLLCGLRDRGVELTGVRAEHKSLLDLIGGLELKPPAKLESVSRGRQFVIQLGKAADDAWHDMLDVITFVGRATSLIGHALIHPRSLRLASTNALSAAMHSSFFGGGTSTWVTT